MGSPTPLGLPHRGEDSATGDSAPPLALKKCLAQVSTSDHGEQYLDLHLVEVWRRWGFWRREQVRMDWKLLVRTLHGSSTGYGSLSARTEWKLISADPCVFEQPLFRDHTAHLKLRKGLEKVA